MNAVDNTVAYLLLYGTALKMNAVIITPGLPPRLPRTNPRLLLLTNPRLLPRKSLYVMTVVVPRPGVSHFFVFPIIH